MIKNLLLSLFLLGPSPLLFAQLSLPLPEPPVAPQSEASAPLQDLDGERARVEAHIAAATKELSEANQALGTPDPLRSQEDQEVLQERVNHLETRIQIGRRHLKVIADARAIREEKGELREEVTGWTGFADPPPYPLAFVEGLARRLQSLQGAITSDELRLASSARAKALAAEQLASAEQEFRRALEALEAAGTDEAKEQARRRLELRRLALSVAGEGAAFIRAGEQAQSERRNLDRLREEFARTRLAAALPDIALTPVESGRLERPSAIARALGLRAGQGPVARARPSPEGGR